MSLEELSQRVDALERQVAELRRTVKPLGPLMSVPETFGMFADDPEFDDIIRYGREYRAEVNSEVPDAGSG